MNPSRVAVATMLLVASLGALPAHAGTQCEFAGPTPGFRAIRLDLPSGSDFLDLRLIGTRTTRAVADGSDWHLVQGVFVLDAATLQLVAYRISSAGSWGRTTIVRANGQTVVDQGAPGPDEPFVHAAGPPVAGLQPGAYDVIAFGSDGDQALPNEWWDATVAVSGAHACTAIGDGDVFDYGAADFTGDTAVVAPGVSAMDGATLHIGTQRSLVVGVMDASVQAAGSARLDFATTNGQSGTVSDAIAPLVSSASGYTWTATVQGAFPNVDVAGVALDLTP